MGNIPTLGVADLRWVSPRLCYSAGRFRVTYFLYCSQCTVYCRNQVELCMFLRPSFFYFAEIARIIFFHKNSYRRAPTVRYIAQPRQSRIPSHNSRRPAPFRHTPRGMSASPAQKTSRQYGHAIIFERGEQHVVGCQHNRVPHQRRCGRREQLRLVGRDERRYLRC